MNGTTFAPLIALYHQAMADDRPPAAAFSASPSTYSVEARKGSDGLFHMTGIANRKPVRFVVDTGATITVLSERDAATLALSPGRASGSRTLRTAGGAAVMTWKTLDELNVGGSRLTDLDVVVVHGGSNQSLLGQDVLSRLGTITMTSRRLKIRPPA